MTFGWLTLLGLLPLVGALVLALPVRGAARAIGLAFSPWRRWRWPCW